MKITKPITRAMQIPTTIRGKRSQMPADQIKYILGVGNYSTVYYMSGKFDTQSRTLLDFERMLPGFIRVSKSVLINPRHHHPSTWPTRHYPYVQLTDGSTFQVSRRRLNEVRYRLKYEQPEYTD